MRNEKEAQAVEISKEQMLGIYRSVSRAFDNWPIVETDAAEIFRAVISHDALEYKKTPLNEQTAKQKLESILKDPATPFWMLKLIPELLQKDCVDVAGQLEVLAQVFGERANEVLKGVK